MSMVSLELLCSLLSFAELRFGLFDPLDIDDSIESTDNIDALKSDLLVNAPDNLDNTELLSEPQEGSTAAFAG